MSSPKKIKLIMPWPWAFVSPCQSCKPSKNLDPFLQKKKPGSSNNFFAKMDGSRPTMAIITLHHCMHLLPSVETRWYQATKQVRSLPMPTSLDHVVVRLCRATRHQFLALSQKKTSIFILFFVLRLQRWHAHKRTNGISRSHIISIHPRKRAKLTNILTS